MRGSTAKKDNDHHEEHRSQDHRNCPRCGTAGWPERAVSKKAAGQKKGTPKAQKTAKSRKAKKEGKTKKNVARPKPSPPRAESKGAQILEMIGRAKGATLAELMQTTGWQAHSVRGFISVARKEHRLKIESSKNEAGDRMYRLCGAPHDR